jgi:tryptophanyl-tRNA synthetase
MMRLIGGARPTGSLHVGHLAGMLRPFLDSAPDAAESYFMIADLHLLTTGADHCTKSSLESNVRQLVAEGVGAGIAPDRTLFVRQSQFTEQAQMYAIVQSLVSWPDLTQHESYVAMADQMDAPSLGLLGYSVLEAADAVALQVTHMAVGEHNVDHAVIAQRIVRALKQNWGTSLSEPQPRTGGENIIGMDGLAKMSKSLGNSVPLSASDAFLEEAVARMAIWSHNGTCVPAKILHGLGLEDAAVEFVARGLRDGSADEARVRDLVRDQLRQVIAPIRSIAAKVSARPEQIDGWLEQGTARARETARLTLSLVHSAIGLAGGGGAREPVAEGTRAL